MKHQLDKIRHYISKGNFDFAHKILKSYMNSEEEIIQVMKKELEEESAFFRALHKLDETLESHRRSEHSKEIEEELHHLIHLLEREHDIILKETTHVAHLEKAS